MASFYNIPMRVALHTGECLLREEKLQVSAVEIAMAVVELAIERQVLVSRTLKDLVTGAGFSFESYDVQLLGEKY